MTQTSLKLHLHFTHTSRRCQPVYCKYRFLGQTHSRRTAGRTPAGKLYWNDTYVVLAGTLDGVALREYLAGGAGHGAGANGASGFGGFVVEVHDRDRKPPKHVEKPPALFGTDPEDEALNTVNYIAGAFSCSCSQLMFSTLLFIFA